MTAAEALSAPDRPPAVLAATVLLGFSALVLLLAWALGIDSVVSNGARVFFIGLWLLLAWFAYAGRGWVRAALIAVFVLEAWGDFNAPSFVAAWAGKSIGDVVAKCLALAALATLWLPSAHRWFAEVRELEAADP